MGFSIFQKRSKGYDFLQESRIPEIRATKSVANLVTSGQTALAPGNLAVKQNTVPEPTQLMTVP